MEIISNDQRTNHLTKIKRLISKADEVIICTAFLKVSGLKPILGELGKKTGVTTFFVGTDYYLTEPDAFRLLHNQGHKIYLTKKQGATFHPKAYYFTHDDAVTLLIGSANLTGGGLQSNFEISALNRFARRSAANKSFRSAVAKLEEYSTLINSELLIAQYEMEFQSYRQKQKKAEKEFKEEMKSKYHFDLSQLDRYVKEYKENNGFKNFANRVERYQHAKRLLNQLLRNEIKSPKEFLEYYEEIARAFYSSGLLRGKTTLARKYKKIISLIRLIAQNKNQPAEVLFSQTLPIVNSVPRFGINGLTEIMNAYNPGKYSVTNARTLKSLSDLEIASFPVANYFDAAVYKKYNNLITEIALKCKFKDLAQVDHFLSWYYMNYYEKP